MEGKNNFHDELKDLMDRFVNEVYNSTQNFPKEEIFGLTSQFRRAALSVILNYIEGYARQSRKSYANFLNISYGSLKECKYLVYFSYRRKYLPKNSYKKLTELSDRIGAMVWGIICKIK